MRQSKVRAENVQHTCDLVVTPFPKTPFPALSLPFQTPATQAISDVILEMSGNLSSNRRNVVNFFIKNLEFFRIDIYFEIYCFILGVMVKVLFSMVCSCPQHAEVAT